MKLFSERLRQARKGANLTQDQLAKMVGAYQTKYQNWESGNIEPDLETVAKLCATLGISADWILGINEKTQAYPAAYEKEVHMLNEEARPYGPDAVRKLRQLLPIVFNKKQKKETK